MNIGDLELVIGLIVLLVGPGGSVWVALNGTKKKVDRIDRKVDRIDATINHSDYGNPALHQRLNALAQQKTGLP